MNRMLDFAFADLQNMLSNKFLYFCEPSQTNFANFYYFPVDLHLNLQYKFRCKFLYLINKFVFKLRKKIFL